MAAGGSAIRLVGVFAHPDDDVYTIGGSLALDREQLDVTLVFCTSGDAGPIWIDGVAREELGAVREAEQAASMAALDVEADVRFLRHPDFHLPDVPLGDLVGEIGAVLREVRPHVVVTFGPDGWSGHHDHVRAGEAADEAFGRVMEEKDGRLLHAAIPRSSIVRFDEELRQLGDPDREARSLLAVRGVPDEDIAIAVDTRPIRETKLAAIEAHRTQVGELERLPEALRWIVLDTECFVQAHPPGGRAGEPTKGLLAGLP
jgi:LmbE family N-acetylglucosaminyl deacetylase